MTQTTLSEWKQPGEIAADVAIVDVDNLPDDACLAACLCVTVCACVYVCVVEAYGDKADVIRLRMTGRKLPPSSGVPVVAQLCC